MKTNRLTSSAGLDKKHLWLVLEQRTVRIVKSLEDPVQLKNNQVTYVGYIIGIIHRRNKTITGNKIIKLASTYNIIMNQPHLQELSICAIYSSFNSVGEQTHHAAVHSPVLWSSTEVLNAHPYALHKKINIKTRKCKTDELQVF